MLFLLNWRIEQILCYFLSKSFNQFVQILKAVTELVSETKNIQYIMIVIVATCISLKIESYDLLFDI